MQYQVLEWDSSFLGIPVVRITKPALGLPEVASVLGELRDQGVRLAYWPSCVEHGRGGIERLGGVLVDRKTTFAIAFTGGRSAPAFPTAAVESYDLSMPVVEFEDLALQSGEQSRFAVDPNIPRERFEALYRLWIQRSLRKEIADEVLVIREEERIAGMVTLACEGGWGDIGLIAVHRDCRGKHYGQQLVRSALAWFCDADMMGAQVVTQGTNLPACNLYRKCGFIEKQVDFYYHFWL